MKRCQMCGSAMRIDAELTEGERHYTWFKCLNISCGAVFLVQKPLQKRAPVEAQAQTNAAG
jgi:hypothetical protein